MRIGRGSGGGMGWGWALALVLGLSGCSNLPTWMGGGVDEKESVRFQAPDPGRSTGLRLAWKRSITGSPAKHFVHPGRIAVTDADVFVGTYKGLVVRVNRKTGDVVWEFQTGAAIMGGVDVDAERVYAGTEQGEVIALTREGGREVWRTRLSSAVDSAPEVADGKVILLTLDNRTFALDAATGDRLWSHSTPAEALVVMGSGTPTAADGMVFVGYSSGEVFVLATEDGHRIWSDNLRVQGGGSELDLMQDVDASVVLTAHSGPQLSPRRAFMVNHQGRVVSYFAATGGRIWERRVSAVRQPLWSAGRLYLVDMDGNLLALGADDGVELWRTRVTDGLLTSPVLYKDQLLVADDQERLFAIDPASGRVLGRENLSGPVLSLPVATEDGLFLWTNGGDLLRYE